MALVGVVSIIMMGGQVAALLSVSVVACMFIWVVSQFVDDEQPPAGLPATLTVSTQLAILVVAGVRVGLRARVAVVIMKALVASIVAVAVGVVLAGHFLVVGVMFLVAIAAITRIVARPMA